MRAAFLVGADDDLVLVRVAPTAQKQADSRGAGAHAPTYEGLGRHGITLPIITTTSSLWPFATTDHPPRLLSALLAPALSSAAERYVQVLRSPPWRPRSFTTRTAPPAGRRSNGWMRKASPMRPSTSSPLRRRRQSSSGH